LSQGWERDWAEQELPDDFHDVLAVMGSGLHDTVLDPDIAENFGCLPEQISNVSSNCQTCDARKRGWGAGLKPGA